MKPSDVTRAIAAATEVAASLDLPANHAIVLHNSNKLALRLTPCDVLARVTPVGQEDAQLEVDLAQRLAEAGCPVGVVEPRVEPLVHVRGGFAVTLWTYYEPVTPQVHQLTTPRRWRGCTPVCGRLSWRAPGSRIASRRRKRSLTTRISRRSSPTRTACCSAARWEACDGRSRTTGRRSSCSTASRIQATCSARRTARCSSTSRRAVTGPSSSTSPTFPRRCASTTRDVNQGLLDDCRQLVLAMVAAWRWRLATSSRTGGDWDRNSCARCARVHLGRHSTR